MSNVNLTGEKVRIYAKERTWSGGTFISYSACISSKDKDGNWVNGYLDVAFKKGVEIANKSDINIKSAFPRVRKSGDKSYVSWMITDFDIVTAGVVPNGDGFMDIPDGIDEEMPFT